MNSNASAPYYTTRHSLALLFLTATCWWSQSLTAQVEILDQVVAIVDDDIVLASELQAVSYTHLTLPTNREV